ncbi:hypothetical protein ADIWIN_2581 [Winogradskyella psychrotolerans RS-3]|uniref:4'-phosphopantetheinyl transferase domain-containing protein n=1 Tax=Winogradskyella psychrotolerans RS-3 TaxID=641526 RepID=S7VQY5_9FLAO|nr:4'-phosphopantetheinyl transferase superfamily protein [Winogradskyella psychrotolerans]EPR72411.1 hypothetical protein ADIWIN_2581 [Winogradskyella psychrotolerans RS-3]
MVGNDIVDLEEAKFTSHWQRPRYLEKIFTETEQQLIKNCTNPFHVVWRLWSMKESAYKLYVQINPSQFYNPKSFECEFEFENGNVKYKNFECKIKTSITSKYILSEARLLDVRMTSEVIEFKDKTYKNQSAVLRNALLITLSELYQLSKEDLKFQKSEFNIPIVLCNSVNMHVSLTHHGHFGAYAI